MAVKIIHLITDLDTGGAEISLFRLLAGMDRQQFDNQVISLIPVGRVGEKIKSLGIKVRALNMRPGRPNPSAWITLAAWLRREKPDILQTWLYHADLLGIMVGRAAGIPAVIWNIRNSNIDFSQYRWLSRFVVRACTWMSGWPQVVISNSYAGRDFHLRLGYRPRRWAVIPNGIDLRIFKPDPQAGWWLRQELNLAPDTLLIGQVARYDPMKDHQGFLRAAGELVRSGCSAHFVMAGEGVTEQNTTLLEMTIQQGLERRVHMLGRRDDIPHLVAALDLLSNPTFGEGFPNVVAEAMACGIPCVVTDVGDSAYLVGETGIVVSPGDFLMLAGAWKRLLASGEQARRELGLAARERIGNLFSLNKMISAYQDLYLELTE